LMKRMSVG